MVNPDDEAALGCESASNLWTPRIASADNVTEGSGRSCRRLGGASDWLDMAVPEGGAVAAATAPAPAINRPAAFLRRSLSRRCTMVCCGGPNCPRRADEVLNSPAATLPPPADVHHAAPPPAVVRPPSPPVVHQPPPAAAVVHQAPPPPPVVQQAAPPPAVRQVQTPPPPPPPAAVRPPAPPAVAAKPAGNCPVVNGKEVCK